MRRFAVRDDGIHFEFVAMWDTAERWVATGLAHRREGFFIGKANQRSEVTNEAGATGVIRLSLQNPSAKEVLVSGVWAELGEEYRFAGTLKAFRPHM